MEITAVSPISSENRDREYFDAVSCILQTRDSPLRGRTLQLLATPPDSTAHRPILAALAAKMLGSSSPETFLSAANGSDPEQSWPRLAATTTYLSGPALCSSAEAAQKSITSSSKNGYRPSVEDARSTDLLYRTTSCQANAPYIRHTAIDLKDANASSAPAESRCRHNAANHQAAFHISREYKDSRLCPLISHDSC